MIGIKNDGTIVGIPPASHCDDAALQQRVNAMLNATPRFTYSPIDVAGVSVGVYEIMPGGRPHFSLVDASPSLQRSIAKYRSGTSTFIASPTQIIDWHREDDADGQRIRRLELEEREAERRIHATVVWGRLAGGRGESAITLVVNNLGRRVITIKTLRWQIVWTPTFAQALKAAITEEFRAFVPKEMEPWIRGEVPSNYRPLCAVHTVDSASTSPGGTSTIDIPWKDSTALEHFAANGLPLKTFTWPWARFHFELDVVGELGTEAMLTCEWESHR